MEGLRRAGKLAAQLAEKAVVVVSGLADGIDATAHRAAMAAGGRTIAVIGPPLDRCFPAKNAALQEEIYREHLLVSQFSPGSKVSESSLPAQNRTIAMLSHDSVVVEATESSGNLSQAAELQRLGRPLFIMRSLSVPATIKGIISLHDTNNTKGTLTGLVELPDPIPAVPIPSGLKVRAAVAGEQIGPNEFASVTFKRYVDESLSASTPEVKKEQPWNKEFMSVHFGPGARISDPFPYMHTSPPPIHRPSPPPAPPAPPPPPEFSTWSPWTFFSGYVVTLG